MNKNQTSSPDDIVRRLISLQDRIRSHVVQSHIGSAAMHGVSRVSSADTIYQIDTEIEPILCEFVEGWARETAPIVLIAEGLEDSAGNEVQHRIFPEGAREEDAPLRVIVDPIDGTRGLMYDKRPAWSLAGAAANHGLATRLRDIQVAVMTELPTSKLGFADQLWAIRGRGTTGRRIDLRTAASTSLAIKPSTADTISHGFASVSNFFPGTKVLASELMEHLAEHLVGPADVHRATVFDDQYISTGGQWYEMIVGHDRFNADLRPAFYQIAGLPEGLCCHPYDCAAILIAEEAGIILTDSRGQLVDGPLDTTTGLDWVGYANSSLREKIEPLLLAFLAKKRQRMYDPKPLA